LVSVAEDGRGMTAISPGELSSKPIRGYPNGITCLGKTQALAFARGNQGNWNILVPWGREIEWDSPSSGERKGNSPNLNGLTVLGPIPFRGCKTQRTVPNCCHRVRKRMPSQMILERTTTEGDSPVGER